MALDPQFAARGAPRGSMRWHALLYAPAPARDRIAAAFALESELADIGRGALDHGVAHAKLRWWREEAARLAAAAPRHPLTIALLDTPDGAAAAAATLSLALGAVEIELAQVVLADEVEFDSYLLGAAAAVAGLALGERLPGDGPGARFAASAGGVVRIVEIVRDLSRDARGGRVFLPWAWVEHEKATLDELQSGVDTDARRRLAVRLAGLARRRWAEIEAARAPALPQRRSLSVLAQLHLALLADMERTGFPPGPAPAELAPLKRTYLAWRAARRA